MAGYADNTCTVVAYNASGSAFGTTVTFTGNDTFIVKYNSSGVIQWITSVRGNTAAKTTSASSISTTSDGGMVVCGYYTAALTAYHANGGAFGTTLSFIGAYDVFVIKYNSSGTCQWTTRITGTGSEFAGQVCCASDGSIVVNGHTASATATVYNATGVASTSFVNSSEGNWDSFLVKYDSNGVVQWAASQKGTGGETASKLCGTGDGGYVSFGWYNSATLTAYNANGAAFGTVLTNSNVGAMAGCIIKYNSSGNVQWVAQTAQSGTSVNLWDSGVASTTDGGIFVSITLQYGGSLTAYNASGTTYGTTMTISTGSNDIYIVKYSSSGYVEWCTKLGGTSNEQAKALCDTMDGCLVTVGYYYSTTLTAYNANGTAFGTTLALSTASNNAFIVKYSM
jgi:hypothetical protein